MKKAIGIILIFLLIGLTIYGMQNNGIPVRSAISKKGKIKRFVEERAITTLPKIYHITMPLSGRVLPITLKEGDQVKKGAFVAKLATFDLEKQLTEAKSKLTAILSKIKVSHYNSMENTAMKESASCIQSVINAVNSSRKKVEASKARMDYTQWWLKKTEELHEKKTHSLQKLKEAKTSYVEAKVAYQSDNFTLHAMEAFLTATKLMPVYVKQYLVRKKLSREVLLSQKRGIEAFLARAKRNLERSSIVSPVDGIILKRYISNERVLPAGTQLLEIGELNKIQITANILTEDVIRVRKGNTVEIYGASATGKILKGKVLRIDPKGFTKVSSLGVEQQRVSVIISITPKDLTSLSKEGYQLGVGYRVRVKIYTQTKENIIKIPRTAIFKNDDGDWEVFIIREGKAQKNKITVGIMNDEEVEVLSGLKEKERVIIAPESSLENNARVYFKK